MNKGVVRKIEKVARKRGLNVNIEMKGGVIHLEGKVKRWEDALFLGIFAGKIKGVKGVVNNLDYGKKKREAKEKRINKREKADVVIVGGGVIGCFIARELSRYDLKVILVEKEDDVGCGTTKANNGMIHSGIGEDMGTLKQKLCIKGNSMYEKIAKELNVPFKKCGMWIIITKDTLSNIPSFLSKFIAKRIIPFIILRRGKKLGIPLKLVKRGELLREEPYITEKALVAIYSPTYAIICPYRLTIALAENAIENGVKIMLNTEVQDVLVEEKKVRGVITNKGIIESSFVINASGLYADEIADMAGAREYTIHPKKGATLLFDKETKEFLNRPMALLKLPQIPHYKGGGILLTVDDNIQWGPTIQEIPDKEDTSVTAEEIEEIFEKYTPLMPQFPKKAIITYFSGIRAATYTEDFFIKASKKVKGFVHVAGIQSPGLAAAPAIAEMVIDILKKEGLHLEEKEQFNPMRKKPFIFRDLSLEEKKKAVRQNPLYGRIICRCEHVTEGEIVDAIHGILPAHTIDAIKRRTRAGMGRCQGAFCLPKVARILAREIGIPMEKIIKNEKAPLFVGKAKILLRAGNEN